MKKHSLAMVFLLIFTLSLISAVSASDNVTVSDADDVLISQGECEMDLTEDLQMSEDSCELSYEYMDTSDESVDVSDNSQIHTKSLDGNYKLGYEITADFTKNVPIVDNDNFLVITNAGYLEINNQTTANVLNGIIDASNGYMTYDDGNLIVVSSNLDSLFISFLCKNDESLTIAIYKDSTTPLYYGNVGPEMSASYLECLMLDEDNLESYLSIFNSWANGSLDDLNLITYQEYVPFGLLSENNKLQAAKYYPHEFNLPLVGALGVSRDFDDDAFILGRSNSSGEKASLAVNMVGKSMEESSSLNLYDIGVDATNKALKYLKSQGVDIPKDYPYLYVLTSAGHVKVNGLKTDEVLDGILDVLLPEFDKKHLISVDDPSWKDLVFYFLVVKNTKCIAYALKYDAKSGKLVDSNHVKKLGNKKAIELGLYSKGSNHNGHSSRRVVHNVVSAVTNATDLNQTANVTNSSSKNSTGNVSNLTKKVNKSDDIAMPAKRNSPFNIVYTLVAILIVCVIFGVGYRKR